MCPDAATPTLVETILVVEDDVLIRRVISEYLRSCGFKVIEAANADEALIVLQKSELAVDIVFSDIEMPGTLDGFGLAQWIRAHRPDLGVILAGSVSRAASVTTELCHDGPIPKPYEPRLVADRIHRLVAARAARKKGKT